VFWQFTAPTSLELPDPLIRALFLEAISILSRQAALASWQAVVSFFHLFLLWSILDWCSFFLGWHWSRKRGNPPGFYFSAYFDSVMYHGFEPSCGSCRMFAVLHNYPSSGFSADSAQFTAQSSQSVNPIPLLTQVVTCSSDSRQGFGFDTGFVYHFNMQLVITLNYNAMADLHICKLWQHMLRLFQHALSSLVVAS
jgi:hypothetical protein